MRSQKEKCSKLIGLGTDGASANVAASGLKVLLKVVFLGFFGCGVWLIV